MKKLYYSIGEASEIAGVKTHVLRYWETLFSELKPSKNNAGKRVYTEKDIEVVLRLKSLIRDKKFSTAGAKKAIKSAETKNHAPSLPVHIRRELNEIKFFLNGLLEKL
jgi:DNA-binding transcriptional MerR regulator